MPRDEDNRTLTPELRFPEFRERARWEEKQLRDVADFITEKTVLSGVTVADYVSTENLLPEFGGLELASKLPPASSVTRYRVDDVLISNIRPYLKKVWRADRNGGASNDVIVVRAKPELSKDFLPLVLRSDSFITYVMSGAKGLKMPRGDVASIREYPVVFPANEDEQQKIADCLTSLDELIAAQRRKVAALKAHKNGLMQQLFPREGETLPRLRFSEFRDRPEWETRKISSILAKMSKAATLDDNAIYQEIGVRSHGKGLFHKEPITGKAIGAKRVFHVVPHALVINIVFAWEQALAVTTLDEIGFIASHRFPMFVPKADGCDVAFMQRLFLMPAGKQLFKVASPGGAGRNRTLSQKEFENLDVIVPSTAEQQRIAACLGSLDARLAVEAEKLATLKTHKKGLMQQLFPSAGGD